MNFSINPCNLLKYSSTEDLVYRCLFYNICCQLKFTLVIVTIKINLHNKKRDLPIIVFYIIWSKFENLKPVWLVIATWLPSWAVWHSCRMGARNQEQTRGRIGPQLRLGNLRVGELHFCPLCTALDQASSLSRKLAYVPGLTFGFVKLLASSGSHCTKWADEQHWQAGFESRLLPDLPLPFIPTLTGLRAFDLVSSRVWWEAATNKWLPTNC